DSIAAWVKSGGLGDFLGRHGEEMGICSNLLSGFSATGTPMEWISVGDATSSPSNIVSPAHLPHLRMPLGWKRAHGVRAALGPPDQLQHHRRRYRVPSNSHVVRSQRILNGGNHGGCRRDGANLARPFCAERIER